MAARPFTYGIETVTWEECARLIQAPGALNRPLSARRAGTIARAVEGRRFYMTHQGVAFNPAGLIIDGQHRLAAHARTKTDYIGLVCRYTDAAYAARVMAVFDSGRGRSTADGLAIGGTMKVDESRGATAVANAMMQLMLDDGRRDIQETGDFFDLHKTAIRWSLTAIPKVRGGAVIRAAFAIAYETAASKVTEFAAQVREGAAVSGSAAALWNRAAVDGSFDPSGGRASRRDVALRALRVLRAHISGEAPPARLYATADTLEWFLKRPVATPPGVKPEARLSDLEKQILAAIPKEGARLADIGRTVGRHWSQVRHNLVRMQAVGVVNRPEVGFYTLAA